MLELIRRNITLFTTDARHVTFIATPIRGLMSYQYIPIIMCGGRDDFIPMIDIPKVFMPYLFKSPFHMLLPLAHIQMQDHDDIHKFIIGDAKSLGIPTFVIQHGLSGMAPGTIAESADYVFVWSASEADKIACHYPSDKIIVTGNPRYDLYPRRTITQHRKVVLTTRPFMCTDGDAPGMCKESAVDYTRQFARAVTNLPDMQFSIRTHPSSLDDQKFYAKIMHEEGAHSVRFERCDIDLSVVIGTADIIVSFPDSSSRTDAAVCGIPTIDISDGFDITEEIQRIRGGAKPRSHQYDDIPRDTKSGLRIATFISEVIRERKMRNNIND